MCFWLIYLLVQATGPSAVGFPFGGNGSSHSLAAQFVPMALASGLATNFTDGNTKPAREELFKIVVKGCNLHGLRAGFDAYVERYPHQLVTLHRALVTVMSTADQVLLLCMCKLWIETESIIFQ